MYQVSYSTPNTGKEEEEEEEREEEGGVQSDDVTDDLTADDILIYQGLNHQVEFQLPAGSHKSGHKGGWTSFTTLRFHIKLELIASQVRQFWHFLRSVFCSFMLSDVKSHRFVQCDANQGQFEAKSDIVGRFRSHLCSTISSSHVQSCVLHTRCLI